MLIREAYAAGADVWSRILDDPKHDRATIPRLVIEKGFELLYPIRVQLGIQRVEVLTCWPWLRNVKHDSFLYAVLSGQGGWRDQQQFLDTITEETPIPILTLLPTLDADTDVECLHLILLLQLVHARALDDDPVFTTEETKRDPEYKSRAAALLEEMPVSSIVHVLSLADQYGM